MAQYKIEATSEKKNATVSNATQTVVVNPGEEGTPSADINPFPSPTEYATKAEADAAAEKFAVWLNHEDYQGAWDWVGKASTV
jgi:hypothetical protein